MTRHRAAFNGSHHIMGYIMGSSMTLDLTDDQKHALAELLRSTIDHARYPLSPRLAPLKAILARLEPSEPRPELPPPLRAYDAPRVAGRRRRRG
jgi:hypothetical protein